MIDKYKIWICVLLVMGSLATLTSSCKKADEKLIDDPGDKIIDKDGNVYTTDTIGTQVWMKENLKTTKYKDGTTIPLVTDSSAWAALSTPGYCWMNNNDINKTTYGALYNWYAVDAASNGGKDVCPTGWHVPTDAEWTTLSDYLISKGDGYGGSGDLIGKSMAATSAWAASAIAGHIGNDQGNNNHSGFTAFPGGFRNTGGTFLSLGQAGHWRSTTSNGTGKAWYRSLNYNFGTFYRNDYGISNGYSVRCLKD